MHLVLKIGNNYHSKKPNKQQNIVQTFPIFSPQCVGEPEIYKKKFICQISPPPSGLNLTHFFENDSELFSYSLIVVFSSLSHFYLILAVVSCSILPLISCFTTERYFEYNIFHSKKSFLKPICSRRYTRFV